MNLIQAKPVDLLRGCHFRQRLRCEVDIGWVFGALVSKWDTREQENLACEGILLTTPRQPDCWDNILLLGQHIAVNRAEAKRIVAPYGLLNGGI